MTKREKLLKQHEGYQKAINKLEEKKIKPVYPIDEKNSRPGYLTYNPDTDIITIRHYADSMTISGIYIRPIYDALGDLLSEVER
jgi:hypothetical protein